MGTIGWKSATEVVALCGALALSTHAIAQDRTTEVFAGFEEWILPATATGNAFDVEASVTFTHTGSGRTITTPMFYDDNGGYRFRFTGVEAGDWIYTTTSPVAELANRTGTVRVNPSSDPGRLGFTSHVGNQWARQRADGGVEAFVPQLVMLPTHIPREPELFDGKIDTFINGHGFTGFHLNTVAAYWFDRDSPNNRRINDPNNPVPTPVNPDPVSFDRIESVIRQTHAAGGHVHIWAWGDEDRRQSANDLAGGANGEVDRRLQRYIAARLGPMPGWSMGYGFDLDEWAGAPDDPEQQVESWHDFILDQSGYDHLLGARSEGPNFGLDHSADDDYSANLGYAGYEHHTPTYDVYRAALETFGDKPVFSEDRFRIRDDGREKDYTAEQTRQGLWLSTMAGGVANIWGDLLPSDNGGSTPYDNAEQLKTYSEFFFERDRYRLGMTIDNGLTTDASHYVLRDGDALLVVYAEDTDVIEIDLSGFELPLSVIAVDAMESYAEIDLGIFEPGLVTIDLSASSNWALAITPIPEPASAAGVLVIGGLLVGRRQRQSR